MKKAFLILSDGTIFEGTSFGAETSTDGEVVFNTGMTGYPQTFSDPSYRGQILCLTYPLQGNYGMPDFEAQDEFGMKAHYESEGVHIRALIVSSYSEDYNHYQAKQSLGAFLKEHNIPAIQGIDTRTLTKKIREHGVMLGKIVISEEVPDPTVAAAIQDPNDLDLVGEVSIKEVITYGTGKKRICLVDTGEKNNILRCLLHLDTTVIRVPYDYPFMDGSLEFDGLFFSNGPGDPDKNEKTIAQAKKALDANVKIFGICLGNQILALAAGGKTYKLKYGHRGQNQPCINIKTGKCMITSQNHGFAVDADSLPDTVKTWFTNANDGTNEGMYFTDKPVKSVQFHPESTPGPEDASYLFKEFVDSL